MYIVVNEDKITIKRTLKDLNKKLNTKFTQDEFKKYNADYILSVNNDDLDYKRDVNELSKVFINKLYRKDASTFINYAFYAIFLIMLLIILTSTNSTAGMLKQVVQALKAGGLL